MVQINKKFPKILIFKHNLLEIVQNSKSETKKFSFLCTFNIFLSNSQHRLYIYSTRKKTDWWLLGLAEYTEVMKLYFEENVRFGS
jgi:hypothetical protein